MYARIKAAVQAAGYPCYDPGCQAGRCVSPYVVVHDQGTTPQPGTRGMLGQRIYEIVCLVPNSKAAGLEPMTRAVAAALAPLSPLRPTGEKAPAEIEQNYQAQSMSMVYVMPVRLA